MNGNEERLSRLEKQMRVYRVLTIIVAGLLALLLGWIAYAALSVYQVIETKGAPLRIDAGRLKIDHGTLVTSLPLLTKTGDLGQSLLTTAYGDTMYVSLVARDQGWALQMHDKDGLVGENGEMSLTFRPSEKDGSPTLRLIDKNGKEVWHAP